jgi:phosphomannomutase
MKDYSKAYKAYDIRSLYDDPIDDVFAFNLGRALGREASARHGGRARIVIGSDVRMRNNTLIYWFVKGIKQGGTIHVISAGMQVDPIDDQQSNRRWVCSTSMMYYISKGDFSFGAQFTASHNPAAYAGIKIVDHQAVLQESGFLQELVGDTYDPLPSAFDQDECDLLIGELMQGPSRAIINANYKEYTAIMDTAMQAVTKKYCIVVDYVNGAAIAYERKILTDLCARYGHTLIEINTAADAQFRAHLSDTTDPHEYHQLSQAVLEHQADIGFMFDGDGDRTGVVDNTGTMIVGDVIVAILTQYYLQISPPWSAVVYDVTSTNAILDVIKQYWWKAVSSRVGHRFIKEQYKEHQAVFGGELSGHLFFSEVGGFESALFALLLILRSMDSHADARSMVDSIMPYYKPALINYTVEDVPSALEAIKQAYKNSTQDYTDGIRIDGAGWWLLVRGSNTEPKVRFYAETRTVEQYEEIKSKVEKVLGV